MNTELFPNLSSSEAAVQLSNLQTAGLIESHDRLLSGSDFSMLGGLSLQGPSAQGVWKCLEVEGAIPRELNGDLYRVCAGQRQNHGISLRHRFDGDAFLVHYSIKDGKVTVAARYVETPERSAELRAGRMLYDEFGTLAPVHPAPGRKNQPSVNIIRWDGRLLGLSEGGHPSAIDADTLAFQEYWDFHGTLPNNVTFTAHPKFDLKTGLGYAFGIRKAQQMELVLFRMEFDGTLKEIVSLPQEHYCMVHDMLLGTEHLVLVIPPVHYDLASILAGEVSGAETLRFLAEKPMRLIVVRKDGSGSPNVVEVPSGMIFHHGNLSEHEGVLSFESLTSPDDSALKALAAWQDHRHSNISGNQLMQIKLDITGQLLERSVMEAGQEFPRFDERFSGRSAAYLYTLERNREDNFSYPTLIKRNVLTGRQDRVTSSPNQTLEEVVFAPRSALSVEGDGWLIGQGYDATRDENFLEIRDAATLDLAARAWTGQHFPLGFHGNFYAHT